MSLYRTVSTMHNKMRQGTHSITVEKSADGKGYISTMHKHDYPMESSKHVHTSIHALKKHIHQYLPLKKGNDEDE